MEATVIQIRNVNNKKISAVHTIINKAKLHIHLFNFDVSHMLREYLKQMEQPGLALKMEPITHQCAWAKRLFACLRLVKKPCVVNSLVRHMAKNHSYRILLKKISHAHNQ